LLHSCWCIAFGCWNSNSKLEFKFFSSFQIVQILFLPTHIHLSFSAHHSNQPAVASRPRLAPPHRGPAPRLAQQLAAASPTPPPPTPQPMTSGPHRSPPSPRPCSGRTRPSLTRRRSSLPLACVPVRGPHAKGSLPGYLRRRHPLGPLIQTLAAPLTAPEPPLKP
jgi:hypothetical protein